TDHNTTEVIYKKGDGTDGVSANYGANVYAVCTVRDGLRSCGPDWIGPNPMVTTGSAQYVKNSNGPGYLATQVSYNYSPTGTMVGDFTGHGKTEILYYCNATPPGAG